jgi:hypothetical protein
MFEAAFKLFNRLKLIQNSQLGEYVLLNYHTLVL